MKIKLNFFVGSFLLMMSYTNAISLEHYQQLCGDVSDYSLQGKQICAAHKNRISASRRSGSKQKGTGTFDTMDSESNKTSETVVYDSRKPNIKPPATKHTKKARDQQHSLSSSERRNQLKFTPYTPGAFSLTTKEEKDAS